MARGISDTQNQPPKSGSTECRPDPVMDAFIFFSKYINLATRRSAENLVASSSEMNELKEIHQESNTAKQTFAGNKKG